MADDIHIAVSVDRPPELVAALKKVWEASVRATHDFLGEEDIIALREEVDEALRGITTLVVLSRGDTVLGFAGLERGKLEMLFLVPECCGQGLGRQMLRWAVRHGSIRVVDVNEANRQALGFYRRMGFRVTGRAPQDSAGRPFPLLHLHLAEHDAAALTDEA